MQGNCSDEGDKEGARLPRSVTARLAGQLPFFYGWVVVGVVFVTMAFGVNARTGFSLLFPPILAEFGWERGITAGAFSFGFLVSAGLSPILGQLMDRRGPCFIMELGVAATTAGLLLATFATAPWHVYATLGILVGAGSVCMGYTGQALFLPSWFVRRRGLAMSIAFSGVGVGSIAILPWLQTVIERAGWRTACWTLGITIFVVLAPLNLLLRHRPQDIGLEPDGGLATPGVSSWRLTVVDPSWAAIDWTLGRALRTARFWWIATGYFGALFAWYAVQVHQTKYLVEIGFTPSAAAWALGAVSLAGIPGQIALGSLSDRVGREAVWALGNAGFAVAYAALILLHDRPWPWLLYVMVATQGMLGYGLTSVIGAIPAEVFEGRHYGAIFGTVMLGAIAGGALGPWFTGVVHDVAGSYAPAFVVAILCSAFSTIAIWRAAPGKVRAVGRAPRHAPDGEPTALERRST
jgi:MFS family permease